jgi:hypothetical protein
MSVRPFEMRGALLSFLLSQTVKRAPGINKRMNRKKSSENLNLKGIRRLRVIFQKIFELGYKC